MTPNLPPTAMTKNNSPAPDEITIRPHRFDGIEEYDQRLPNWWLLTFYGAIAFACFCWLFTQQFAGSTNESRVEAELARIEAAKFANAITLDDATLWQMSRNPVIIAAGRETFNATCAACHLASLRGKEESPIAIGPNLTDQLWIHGGRPMELNTVATAGVLTKGMPAWGPVLGTKRISEAVAYILSYHKEGEPIVIVPPAAPPVAPPK